MFRRFRWPKPASAAPEQWFVEYECRHGRIAIATFDDTIRRSLELYGEWAEFEAELMSHFVPKGGLVFDVGANVGSLTLAFARMVGPTGSVYAFEPFGPTCSLLTHNALPFQNVVVHNALVSHEDTMVMVSPVLDAFGGNNLGAVSFTPDRRGGLDRLSAGARIIPQMQLNSFRGLDPALVKIDVEGMEFNVLRGATELLSASRPAIYFEQNGPANFADTHGMLTQLGYTLFYHRSYPFNPRNYRGEAHNIFGDTSELNILCVHQSRLAEKASVLSLLGSEIIEADSPTFLPPAPLPLPSRGSPRDWLNAYM